MNYGEGTSVLYSIEAATYFKETSITRKTRNKMNAVIKIGLKFWY
jgi:hypothetical protein